MNLWPSALWFLAQTPSPTPGGTPAADKSLLFWVFYFASPFIAPCITVGLGGWWIQRSFVSRANASAFADALVKRMDELLADSLEYWNNSPQESAFTKRDRVLSQKIKGNLKILISDLRHFQDKYVKPNSFDEQMGNIFDTCTGGDFERVDRGPDSARYLMVVNTVNSLKSQIIRVKL